MVEVTYAATMLSQFKQTKRKMKRELLPDIHYLYKNKGEIMTIHPQFNESSFVKLKSKSKEREIEIAPKKSHNLSIDIPEETGLGNFFHSEKDQVSFLDSWLISNSTRDKLSKFRRKMRSQIEDQITQKKNSISQSLQRVDTQKRTSFSL